MNLDLSRVQVMEQRYKIGWCGPASVAHAMIQLGLPKPNQKLLGEAMGTTFRHGTSGGQMIKGAKLFGMEARWVQNKSLDQLKELKEMGAAIILNWMSGSHDKTDGHYSVLEQLDETEIAVADPDWMGRLSIFRRGDFQKIWYDCVAVKNKTKLRHLRNWAMVVVNPHSGLALNKLLEVK